MPSLASPRSLVLAAAACSLLLGAAPAGAATVTAFPVPAADAGLTDIAAGPDGNLWFTERSADRVGRITPAGQIQEFAVPKDTTIDDSGPEDIVDGGDGNLWFLNDVNEAVDRISPLTGTVTEVFFNQIANGRHISPFPGGGVWETLATSNNDTAVRVVHANGTVEEAPGGLAGGRAPIATAPNGSAWYADGASALRSFTPTGQQSSYPLPPQYLSEDVRSIAFDGAGTLFYTQYYGGDFPLAPHNGRIGILGADGQARVTDLGGDYLPESITLGPDGAMWWAEKNGIGRRAPDGTIQHASLGAFQADAIAFGADGALWFIDGNANRIGRIAIDGALFPPPPAAPVPVPKPIPAPPVATPVAPRAPKATLKVTSPQRLRTVRANQTLKVLVKLPAAGTVSLRATLAASTAKRLKLTVAKGAKTATIASASKAFKRSGTATVTLRFGTKARSALKRARSSLKLTLIATTKVKGATSTTVTRTVTLKR